MPILDAITFTGRRDRPIISRYFPRDSGARLPDILFKTDTGEEICTYTHISTPNVTQWVLFLKCRVLK